MIVTPNSRRTSWMLVAEPSAHLVICVMVLIGSKSKFVTDACGGCDRRSSSRGITAMVRLWPCREATGHPAYHLLGYLWAHRFFGRQAVHLYEDVRRRVGISGRRSVTACQFTHHPSKRKRPLRVYAASNQLSHYMPLTFTSLGLMPLLNTHCIKTG